ncbi:MAG: hypothetical protein CL707_00620 [Chloroflexi bacterium]|nr:hypothetical protein [Chloroflexota bacterium]|tara:strand:+ start:3500 stop:3688 length:189 start_codon:yes stop_codon:yes gene_type:complete
MTGVTPAEFLAIIPKKDEEDHEWDKKEMQKAFGKLKEIELNPKIDLEQAIKNVNKLMKKNDG